MRWIVLEPAEGLVDDVVEEVPYLVDGVDAANTSGAEGPLRTLQILFDHTKQTEHLAFTELLSDETRSPSSIIDMLIDPEIGFAYLFEYSPSLPLWLLAQHTRLGAGQLGSLVIACAALATRAHRAGYCLSAIAPEHLLIDGLGAVWLADSGSAHAVNASGNNHDNGARACCLWGIDPRSLLETLNTVGESDALVALTASVKETFELAEREDLLEVAMHVLGQVVSPAQITLPNGLS